ncbi:hypothetical protein, partial [Streptomyces alfalfae]
RGLCFLFSSIMCSFVCSVVFFSFSASPQDFRLSIRRQRRMCIRARLLAVRGLLRRTEDHDQVLLRAPGPSEPALCHGIVTMPADAPLREMPVG